ncbi:MAG: sugar transferase [Lachnospiraceae bacterium]|nr:sugar transferase [Lachnospiraceae bacterium]
MKKRLPIYGKPVSGAIKAAADRVLALLALLFLSPLFLFAAAGILLTSPGPVFYEAKRMGMGAKPITIYKFRTMRVGADRDGSITAANDSRVFPFGEFLRKSKIDELPQLINILKGEMSVVGPRPEDIDIVRGHYTEEEMDTLRVLPGLACPGSIFNYTHGDAYLQGEDAEAAYTDKLLHVKLALDLYYLKHWSLLYDIRIIFRTIDAILSSGSGQKEYPFEYRKLYGKKDAGYRKEKRAASPDAPLVALLTNNDDDVYCFRLELVNAIMDAGYRMLISCPDGPKFEVLEELGLRKGKEFLYDDPDIDRRGTNVIKDGKLLLHYFLLFKKYRPAVVLAYTAKPNVYAGMAAHLMGIPVIGNLTGLGSVVNETGMRKLIIMSLFRYAYRRAYCMMFQNAANMHLALRLGMVKGKYRLIPGSGVALERFALQDYPEGGDGRQGGKVIFNYIGRVLHDKGVDDYIEAARRIRERYPETEFNMLGFIEPTEMHYEQELQKLQEEGIVFYRGSQKDVRPWVERAHCIIHPSTYGEGMSNVLLENAASGRPIITTDNHGCCEAVDEGVSGLIYHGGDVDELCRMIEQFLAMPNEKRCGMGLAGRRKMEKEFDRQIVIDAYLENIDAAIWG